MKYLGLRMKDLQDREALNTAREIASQPSSWEKTYKRFLEEKEYILQFLQKVWEHDFPYIILTGAGTSAFIGEALVGSFQKKWNGVCRAIATTDIITHPENYFIKSRPTLLISFARSGDSPESVAAVELAKEHCDCLYELNITCNKDGALAKKIKDTDSYTFLLPEETNDQSLAMTSSFSSMLLTGLLISNILDVEQLRPTIDRVCELGNYVLNDCLPDIQKMAETDFKRMVFMGSGPLFGIAHESHLKVQELSNGKVICKFDSFLGFRHGPKAVVDDTTVVVYLLSNSAGVQPYELDLVRSAKTTAAGERSIAIGNSYDESELKFDLSIRFPGGTEDIQEEFLSVFYILPAQIIGFYKSLSLGLSPDSPSQNGAISRVVQGVKIYHLTENEKC
jgi:tagatose-6-phosphate ketose/aldose isomerase